VSQFSADYLAYAFPMLLEEHGETVLVSPVSGTPAPGNVTAIVEWIGSQSSSTDLGRETDADGTLLVDPGALTGWVPNEEGDTFTIGGEVYALTKVVQDRPFLMLEFRKVSETRFGGSDIYAQR